MTTQTIVFLISYLIGVAAAFRAGKEFWIKKFINDGYVLVEIKTIKMLEEKLRSIAGIQVKIEEEEKKDNKTSKSQ